MMGSANITGGKLFHILSGNLSTRSSTTCSGLPAAVYRADSRPR